MPAMPKATRTRHSWFSYSLRSLLAFVTLLSVGMAWVAYERRQSQRELKLAEQLAASEAIVVCAGLFDLIDPFNPSDDREAQSWWRRALSGLCGRRIRTVGAGGHESFTDLAPLAVATSLESIFLHGAPISDLSPLARLTSLKIVLANETAVSDLSPLAGLRNLKGLLLEGTPVSDLSPLAGLESLESLDLKNTQVQDVSPVARLNNLAVLSIEGTRVCDLGPLAGLKNLEGIFLSRTPVSDLSPLAALKNLRCLHLDGTRVGDLSVVFGFTKLEELTLGDGQIAEEQITSLKQALPGCRVTIVPAARTARAIELERD